MELKPKKREIRKNIKEEKTKINWTELEGKNTNIKEIR
jgi:hypothetical protein